MLIFSRFLYVLGTRGYFGLIHFAALFSGKAKQWVQGRRGWEEQLKAKLPFDAPTLWMHCASLGEFEQGRPVLEALRQRNPSLKVVLTFFSPSGYEVRKDYKLADVVCYLPPDTAHNAASFLSIVKPTLAIFVKYEIWYFMLRELHARGIPTVLISANLRKPSGLLMAIYREAYGFLRHVFVQHASNMAVAKTVLGLQAVTVAGDTRFDRVGAIAEDAGPLPDIEKFVAGRFCFVVGSSWPADEALIAQAWQAWQQGSASVLIVAPHNPHAAEVAALLQQYGSRAVTYSNLAHAHAAHNVLVVDGVGMLSKLYRYANLVWIGGGFTSGIHNVLEAAVYGKRVLFGPKYSKFREANDLIEKGAARCVTTAQVLVAELEAAHAGGPAYVQACAAAHTYVQESRGATNIIVEKLAELKLIAAQ